MLAQALVERSMLDGIADGAMRVKYAVESRIGEGNAKWVAVAALVLLLFWAMRPRR